MYLMNTHTHPREHRRLALISLYASLCSVFALQLALQWVATSEALSASAFRVSALPGDRNLTVQHLRANQTPAAIRDRQATARRVRMMHNAPTQRGHQARTR